MSDKRSLLRHLKVLSDAPEEHGVPGRKFFAIGNASHIEGYGETIALLSFVDDNLSRFVLANAPSTSWGRVSPAPFVYALPNIAVKPKDGIFLITGEGEDKSEPHPSGEGDLKIVFLNRREPLWNGGLHQVYFYRLDGLQTKRITGIR
ncbi:MAG TPA: hypothetical protein VJT73_15770 [Polyangiaceae bacterium]|nr:hypothetical protein [Polyangiaceae bacterium]